MGGVWPPGGDVTAVLLHLHLCLAWRHGQPAADRLPDGLSRQPVVLLCPSGADGGPQSGVPGFESLQPLAHTATIRTAEE